MVNAVISSHAAVLTRADAGLAAEQLQAYVDRFRGQLAPGGWDVCDIHTPSLGGGLLCKRVTVGTRVTHPCMYIGALAHIHTSHIDGVVHGVDQHPCCMAGVLGHTS